MVKQLLCVKLFKKINVEIIEILFYEIEKYYNRFEGIFKEVYSIFSKI